MAEKSLPTAAEAVKLFAKDGIQVNMPKFTGKGAERKQEGGELVDLKAEHILAVKEGPDGGVRIVTVDGQKFDAPAGK